MTDQGPLAGLARRLSEETADELTLRFEELAVLAPDLPQDAWRYPYWWSNNEPGQEQSRTWLDAGFRVAAIEGQGFVTFVRVRDRLAYLEVLEPGAGDKVTGTLSLRDGVVEADEGARWLTDDAFYAALPDGSWARRVSPSDGPAFLVACWFTLREPGPRGRLVDFGGRTLSDDEGRRLVDSLSGTGVEPGDDEPPGEDPTWSGVSLRAPDRNYDPDAAPLRDLFLRVRREMAERKAAGLPEPAPRPRTVAPSGPDWQEGRNVLEAAVRGMRVFDTILGLGTILSVMPQGHNTEVLVRFDSGVEAWRLMLGLQIEQTARNAR